MPRATSILGARLHVERAFTESCLPMTLALAVLFEHQLAVKLGATPTSWSFLDRVVAWLSPALRISIESFHAEEGPDLPRLLQPHQVDALDRVLVQALAPELEILIPGVAQALGQCLEGVATAPAG